MKLKLPTMNEQNSNWDRQAGWWEEISKDKVSLEQLRAIWDDGKQSYTDEQLHQIREWLYEIVEIVITVIHENRPFLINRNNKAHENSNDLHANSSKRAA